jgi:hypothetical protein
MAEMPVTSIYALLKLRYHILLEFLLNYVVDCLFRHILYLSWPGLGIFIHNGAENDLFEAQKESAKNTESPYICSIQCESESLKSLTINCCSVSLTTPTITVTANTTG